VILKAGFQEVITGARLISPTAIDDLSSSSFLLSFSPGEHIDTGYGYGRNQESFLVLDELELEQKGSLEFVYSLESW